MRIRRAGIQILVNHGAGSGGQSTSFKYASLTLYQLERLLILKPPCRPSDKLNAPVGTDFALRNMGWTTPLFEQRVALRQGATMTRCHGAAGTHQAIFGADSACCLLGREDNRASTRQQLVFISKPPLIGGGLMDNQLPPILNRPLAFWTKRLMT